MSARLREDRLLAAKNYREMDDATLVRATIERDEVAWCELMRRFASPLRAAARDANDSLSDTDVDDVLSDLWLSLLESNMQRLQTFDPSRGSALLSWLTMRLAQIIYEREQRSAAEPPQVPMAEIETVADPRSLEIDPPPPALLRVDEVAKRWRLDRKTVYAMIERGELSARRCGRLVRIPRNVVESFESQAGVDPVRSSKCR